MHYNSILITNISKYKLLFSTLLLTALYCFYWPYEANGNDMIEIIPALKKLSFPELYSRDFYLQFSSSLGMHERSFYLYFLHFIGAIHPNILLLLYLICLIFFIIGLFKLISMFVSEFSLQFICVLMVLFVAKYTNIGGNELFYSMPTSAIFAKTFGIWSLNYFLNDKKMMAYALLVASTYFHILVGLQLFIILFSIDLILNYKFIKKSIQAIALYLIFCLPYLISILLSRKNPHSHDNSMVDLLEFRIGHHFFIEYSSIYNIIIYFIIYFIGLYLWKSKNKHVFFFYLIQAAILCIYLIFGDYYRMEFFLQSQWMKTTIWIELFTIVIGVEYFSNLPKFVIIKKYSKTLAMSCFVGVFLVSFFTKKENRDLVSEEIKLAEWAKSHTAVNTLFVYPINFTRFKSVSERSSWIDYKAISHQKAYLIPWYDRIQRVYKIGLENRINGDDLYDMATKNYNLLNDHDLGFLFYTQKVDYIILPTQLEPSEIMYPAFSTERYTIYKRKDFN